MQHKNGGFLFIEVAVVITLIVIIVMLAMPQMSFLKKQIVYSEIEKLATLCLVLRQEALMTHQDQALCFNQKANQYGSRDCIYTLASGIKFGFLPSLYGPPSSPKSLINQAITFNNEKIVFFADGTMSSGTVYIIDNEGICCYALTIPTAQLPFIRKYEYQQHWVPLS